MFCLLRRSCARHSSRPDVSGTLQRKKQPTVDVLSDAHVRQSGKECCVLLVVPTISHARRSHGACASECNSSNEFPDSLCFLKTSGSWNKRMKFRDPLMIRCNSDASQLTASITEFLFLSIHSTAKYSMWHRISKANSMFYAKKAFVL